MRTKKTLIALFITAAATLVACDKQAGDGAEAVSAQNDSITTSVQPAQVSTDLTPTDIGAAPTVTDAAPVVTGEASTSASVKDE